jgi:hypothetical protein
MWYQNIILHFKFTKPIQSLTYKEYMYSKHFGLNISGSTHTAKHELVFTGIICRFYKSSPILNSMNVCITIVLQITNSNGCFPSKFTFEKIE